MTAPDRVWEQLSQKLHNDRRRFGAGVSAFLLLAGLIGYLTISTTNRPTALKQPALYPAQEVAATTASHGAKQSANMIGLPTDRTPAPNRNARKGSHSIAVTNSFIATAASPEQALVRENSNELTTQTEFTPVPVDDYPDARNSKTAATAKATEKPSFLLAHNAAPWSIESVFNSFTRKPSRFRTEFHFAPTISYRKLSENKSYLRTASLLNSPPNVAALYGSVNNMVTHKPDLGFELGVTEKYSITGRLRVRGGLQFNVNRYDIKAFNAPYALATIALNRRGSSRVDSVYTLSSYSNVDASSNKSNWLQNLSFQVSAPIGVELALKGNDKMQFGIAGTVQPTYVIGDRAYLITTNYKNYTQVPWLLRRWNVNTAFETFVSYQSGKARWQVGPQVRYQLLSSFISNYPVKENLFDFGLKIGVSLTK